MFASTRFRGDGGGRREELEPLGEGSSWRRPKLRDFTVVRPCVDRAADLCS
jgi:hypothetical protein